MPPCETVDAECFAWLQAGQQSPVFQFVMRRGPRLLVSWMGVNIRIRIPSHRVQRMRWKWFLSSLWHTSYTNWNLLITRQSASETGKKTRASFFSVRLRCENYFHQIHVLICPTGKNRTGSDPANQKASVLCILFCHQKYSTNNAQNRLMWEFSQYITEKGIGLHSFPIGNVLKMQCHICSVRVLLWSHKEKRVQ
jgi:hypothetical protein